MQERRGKLDLLERLLLGEIDTGLFASGFKQAGREQQERLLARLTAHCLLQGAVLRTQAAHVKAVVAMIASAERSEVCPSAGTTRRAHRLVHVSPRDLLNELCLDLRMCIELCADLSTWQPYFKRDLLLVRWSGMLLYNKRHACRRMHQPQARTRGLWSTASRCRTVASWHTQRRAMRTS